MDFSKYGNTIEELRISRDKLQKEYKEKFIDPATRLKKGEFIVTPEIQTLIDDFTDLNTFLLFNKLDDVLPYVKKCVAIF